MPPIAGRFISQSSVMAATSEQTVDLKYKVNALFSLTNFLIVVLASSKPVKFTSKQCPDNYANARKAPRNAIC